MSTTQRQLDVHTLVPLVALIAGMTSAIFFWWSRGSLWEDEIIAITHGLQPFPGFFVEVLRNDIHPFFYFLLLKIWTAPNLGSDSWALASSLVSGFISAAVFWFITLRVHGQRAAIWAVALYCVLPSTVAAAGNLRMYALVPGIAMACWYANREFLRTGQPKWIVGLVVLQFLQTYSHAIGFFFAAFFALAALLEQKDNADRRRLTLWLAAQVISLLLMLPVVGSALVRGTEPLPVPSLLSLLTFPAHLISGGQTSGFPLALEYGEVTFFFLLAFALCHKPSRITVLVIPCGALLACVLISSMGKPMFKPPVFSANLLPFLVFGAAAAISNASRLSLRLIAVGYTIFLSTSLLLWISNQHSSGNYQPAASHIVANSKPGDVVVIPNVSVYWGIMRYAVDSDWGRPLTTMPIKSNEAWSKLKIKLGPHLVQLLELNPKTDYIEHNGVRYVIGTEARHHLENTSRAWVVHRLNYKESVHLGTPMTVEDTIWFGNELSVSKLRSASSGQTFISNPSK